jgi:two-component system, OmpR family, sensor histidine kinase MtrB
VIQRGRLRASGLRWRITIAFLGGALAVSILVAGTSYVLAERYLTRQRIDDAIQQALGGVRSADDFLARPPLDPDTEEPQPEASLSDLVDRLESGVNDVMLVEADGSVIPSSISLTPSSVPPALAESVERGRVGYAITGTERRRLVFGSRVPGQGVEVFFFFPLADLYRSLEILGRVLIGVSLGAVLLAALAGTRVSTRVVDPVRRVSRAARKVAEGLLETRLPVQGEDELAALAGSFNEMAAALEDRIARERRFVGDVSHELRTPLTTLRASTDYLLEHSEDLTAPVQRAAELLAADLQYLQRLVDDLLDLSRVEAGRVEMSWEPLNLADLAREVVARRTRAGDRVVRVEVESDPRQLATVADKQRLERVVGNLVDNALIHGGGEEVTVRVMAEDGAVLLSVEDRGPGVPPALAHRIFERFYKADRARRRDNGRGSGLGLAIARENAHLHGGEIRVFNGREGGARFTLWLPRRDREPQA